MSTAHSDPTFRAYNADQAKVYATHRKSYSVVLYDEIVKYHKEHGNGTFGTVLDVGCGPGNATRDLAQYFTRAVGTDPGEQMIASARGLSEGYNVAFKVCPAEQIGKIGALIPDGVDMITAAMAAHWFDMASFYSQALPMLKPGGTIALWTHSSLFCHPTDTPNANRVQEILSHFEDVVLGPYELPPNRLSRNMYDDLVLPWSSPDGNVREAFDQSTLVRKAWNRKGVLEPGASDLFAGSNIESLGEWSKGMGTASMVTRWREANPELVGTERDCVRQLTRELANAITGRELQSGDESWKDVKIRTGCATALLMFSKRRA